MPQKPVHRSEAWGLGRGALDVAAGAWLMEAGCDQGYGLTAHLCCPRAQCWPSPAAAGRGAGTWLRSASWSRPQKHLRCTKDDTSHAGSKDPLKSLRQAKAWVAHVQLSLEIHARAANCKVSTAGSDMSWHSRLCILVSLSYMMPPLQQ